MTLRAGVCIVASIVVIMGIALAPSYLRSPSFVPQQSPPVKLVTPIYPSCIPPLVYIGMRKPALRDACGPPASISHQIISANSMVTDDAQWSYHNAESYVYLRDDVVTAIQYGENGEHFSWESLP